MLLAQGAPWVMFHRSLGIRKPFLPNSSHSALPPCYHLSPSPHHTLSTRLQLPTRVCLLHRSQPGAVQHKSDASLMWSGGFSSQTKWKPVPGCGLRGWTPSGQGMVFLSCRDHTFPHYMQFIPIHQGCCSYSALCWQWPLSDSLGDLCPK